MAVRCSARRDDISVMLGLEVNGLFRHIWADGRDVTMNVWDGWMESRVIMGP